MMDAIGNCENQSTAGRPRLREMKAKKPLTGCINRFFQIRAETVGITKKGAITSSRAMFLPKKYWSKMTANNTPRMMDIASTDPSRIKVLAIADHSPGSERRKA